MEADGARAQGHQQQSKFKTSLSCMKSMSKKKKKEGMKEEERQERQREKRRRWRRWRRKRILFRTSHPPTCVEEQGLRDTLVAWIPKSNRTQPSWDHDWTLGLLLSHHPRGSHSPLLPQRSLRGSGWEDLSGTSLPLQSHWSIYLFDFGSFGVFVSISTSPLEKKKDPDYTKYCQRSRDTGWATWSR